LKLKCDDKPPYGRDVAPPPNLRKGQRVVASEIKITSVEGKYGPQFQFDGILEGFDYQARAWVKKYDDPSRATKMYKLAVLADKRMGRWSPSVDDGVKNLESVGRIYFEVNGFREYEGQTYPKFSVVDDELPPPPMGQATGATPIHGQPSKAELLIVHILRARPELTERGVRTLISEEQTRAAGLLTEEAAAYLVARNLGVDLETSGRRIA